jgi:histidinol phosphatase-like enzyme (inositol monophosphatase family)
LELSDAQVAALLQTAHRLADAAREPTLRHFRNTELAVDNKVDGGFDPVTVADRESERVMRAILADDRPDDGILGEEFESVAGTSGLTWVLDPIDGTRGYISGTTTWGVLISVTDDTGPRIGIIDQPFTGERFVGAPGIGGFHHVSGDRSLKTRTTEDLEAAILFSTFPEVGTSNERAGFEQVAGKVALTRYGTDCYAYALLALGQIDLVIEAGLKPYDICAPIAVVEAAGGIFTDWQGRKAHEGGRTLAAANPTLHAKALALLAPFAD